MKRSTKEMKRGELKRRSAIKAKPYRPLPSERVTQDKLDSMRATDIGKNVAWPMMSRYVRMRGEGKGCITCGKVLPWQQMQAGHFRHAGKNNPVSYDPRNINPQCPSCNGMGDGKLDIYATKLVSMYGPTVLEELNTKKHMSLKGKDKRQFMYDVIADLQDKLKAMREEQG
jgi:hypothetical protein